MDLLETIRVVDGCFVNLDAHLRRMEESSRELYGIERRFSLDNTAVPLEMRKGRVKCRIRYDGCAEKMEYVPYSPKQVRSLRLVECNGIDYHLKFADRSRLENLLSRRDGCDDILIVREGLITDTSYSNVVLTDGKRFVTPDSFLLNGCRRRQLLAQGVIQEEQITPDDLTKFTALHLINAMLDLEEVVVPINEIVF